MPDRPMGFRTLKLVPEDEPAPASAKPAPPTEPAPAQPAPARNGSRPGQAPATETSRDASGRLDGAADPVATGPAPHPRELLAAIAEGIRATSEPWAVHVRESGGIDPATDANVDELLGRLPAAWAFGVQVIYEGYLMHEGRSRVLRPDTPTERLLLIGDYCHATGITDLADAGAVDVIDAMARTIAATSTAPADRRTELWAEGLAGLLRLGGS